MRWFAIALVMVMGACGGTREQADAGVDASPGADAAGLAASCGDGFCNAMTGETCLTCFRDCFLSCPGPGSED